MAKSEPLPALTLESWQVWPGSYKNPPADGNYLFSPDPGLRITPDTPIASMGSCFAREIRKVLLAEDYGYITEETDNPKAVHASAAWERTYNTYSMRQIFEYTFEDWQPDLRWWVSPETKMVQDPYRRIILYDSIDEAEEDFAYHKECSRRALQRAEVLILTLGLVEVWEDKVDGSVICLPSGPYPKEGGDMSRYQFKVSRFGENLANLEKIYALMTEHMPGCKLLLTVSPVHLFATFRRDLDILSASCNSKSTLRTVVDEFVVRHDNVFYFPSFEMATIYQPILGKTWLSEGIKENFHVNQETVQFIMKHFFKFYGIKE
ncbi:MAG: GSCFA domain-containing protein [Desulfobulbaceae bacterium]|nr:GSCFA domain-containing protein [Desulfobulbaceae bacterium]